MFGTDPALAAYCADAFLLDVHTHDTAWVYRGSGDGESPLPYAPAPERGTPRAVAERRRVPAPRVSVDGVPVLMSVDGPVPSGAASVSRRRWAWFRGR